MTEKSEEKQKSKEISRREFLKDAGLVVGGAAVGSMAILSACTTVKTITQTQTQTASLTITKQAEIMTLPPVTTTVTPPPSTVSTQIPLSAANATGHIVQVDESVTSCLSCGSCQMACATIHDGGASPSLKRMWMDRDVFTGVFKALTCQQCDIPLCYFACPLKDQAICIDAKTGARYINPSKCIGCKLCIDACPFEPKRINFDPVKKVAIKCDLCMGRTSGPACIEICPNLALTMGKGG